MTKGFVVVVRERRGREGDRNNKLGWNLLNKYLLCRIEFAIAIFTGVRSIFVMAGTCAGNCFSCCTGRCGAGPLWETANSCSALRIV